MFLKGLFRLELPMGLVEASQVGLTAGLLPLPSPASFLPLPQEETSRSPNNLINPLLLSSSQSLLPGSRTCTNRGIRMHGDF